MKHQFDTHKLLRRWVGSKYLMANWLIYEAKETDTATVPRPPGAVVPVIKKLRGVLCYPEVNDSRAKATKSRKQSGMPDRS